MVIAIFVLYYKPFVYMVGEWQTRLYSSYTPGPFVPIVAGYIVWLKRKELKTAAIKPAGWGISVMLVALVIHVLAQRGDEQRVSIFSCIVMCLGIILFIWGKEIAKLLLFPFGFLMFMIPMEFLDGMVGVPLRIFASQSAALILEILGFRVIRIGTQLEMVDVFMFDVAAPCSGLQSLVSLTALGFAFAYLTQKKNWKRLVLIISAIPIAILANVFRVVMIGLIAAGFGKDAAMGFFHMFSGFFLFTFALIAMTGIGRLLSWSRKNISLS